MRLIASETFSRVVGIQNVLVQIGDSIVEHLLAKQNRPRRAPTRRQQTVKMFRSRWRCYCSHGRTSASDSWDQVILDLCGDAFDSLRLVASRESDHRGSDREPTSAERYPDR